MIMTHPSFFSSSCLRGSPKITHPHKQPAQAGKMWSPVRQWSLLGGWRHLTVTALLPLAQLSCRAWMYLFNKHLWPTDYLHLSHPPDLQKNSYEPGGPSPAQHGFQSPVDKSEQPPASELCTYLFNPKGEATSFHLQAVLLLLVSCF